MGQQGPDDPGIVVGEGDRGHMGAVAAHERAPPLSLRIGPPRGTRHDGSRPMNQERPHLPIASFRHPAEDLLAPWNLAEAPDPTRPPGAVRSDTPEVDRRSPATRWPSTDQFPAPRPVSDRPDAADTRALPGESPARYASRDPSVAPTTRRRGLGHTRSIPTPRHPKTGRRLAVPSPGIVPSPTPTRPTSPESDS